MKCWLFSQASPEAKAYNFIACVALISVRFRSKERGTRVKDRVKNGEKWLSFHFQFLAFFFCSETKQKHMLRRLVISKQS